MRDQDAAGKSRTADAPGGRGPAPALSMVPVGFDRAATLHLVTPDAGLVRWQSVLLQILRALPQERHIVLFTAPCRDETVLSQVTAAGGFALQGPAGAVPADYWRWITGRIDLLLPQRVMIHATSRDDHARQAALRLASRFGRRLYLLHGQDCEGGLVAGFLQPDLGGATHVLGPSVPVSQLRAGLRRAGHDGRVHVARLGLPFDPAQNPETMPWSGTGFRGGRRLRSALGAARRFLRRGRQAVAGEGPLTTGSSAGAGDLDRVGADWLADLILGLIRATGGQHVHVGPVDPRLRHAVQLRLKEADLPSGRVVFTGAEAAVANALCHHRVGLFLGSLPGIVQCPGLSGAAWAGIAIARFIPGATDGAQSGPPAQAGLGPDDSLDWTSPQDLCRQIDGGLAPATLHHLRRAAGRWHQRYHSPARFLRRLIALLDRTEGSLTAPVSPEENAAALAVLFDADFYLARYADIARAGIDPLQHYIRHGEREGRSPNPLFSPRHYQAQLPARASRGRAGSDKTSLLAHYLLRGEARGLTPHPYFVPACAAQGLGPAGHGGGLATPDEGIAPARKTVLSSILARYMREGRGQICPHPLFDPAHYARVRGVDTRDAPLLLHYLAEGAEGGLSPHPLIRPAMLQDWGADTPLDGLLYWLGKPAAGPSEPTPDPLFDPAHLGANEAARYAAAAPNMLWAHLIEGNRADRGPHPLIDPAHVATRRAEVLTSAQPLLLDMAEGRMLRIDTHPLVSTTHVLAQAPWCPDHPTRHYVQRGMIENIDPHPWFSTAFYLSQSASARAAGANALVHYLDKGQYDGLLPHPFFDGNDYWKRYLRDSGGGAPLPDYARQGAGRFRTVQPHDPDARAASLQMAEALFGQGGHAPAARLLETALHPPLAAPHPTLRTEIRQVLTTPPAGVDLQVLLPARQLALTRPAVVSQIHVAPPPLRQDLPGIHAGVWPRALVIGGADGLGTLDGGWWPQGPETGALPGSDVARRGALALRPQGPVAARDDAAVLIRRHGAVTPFAEAIFACGSGSDSLDRFLLEVLPRALLAARSAAPGVPVLTEADLPSQALQALRLALPDHPVLQLPRGQAAEIGRLHVAEAVNRLEDPLADPMTGAPLPPPALHLHPASPALLRAAFGRSGQTVPSRRLFLCAETAPLRRLLAADEMTAGLARCGFLQADPARLSFTDLVAMVQDATEIVATDCPQLAVLALARPGTRVWVLQGNAPGTDFHRWDTLGRLAGLEMVTVAGWQVPGSAGNSTRPAEAHFAVPARLVLPFFETRLPRTGQAAPLLDALYGATSEADVLTGAWAVHAGPTPAGFEDRLRALRGQAARRLAEAPEAEITALSGHAFFADFARNIRSGFPVLAGFTAWEAAAAEQLRRSFAGQEAGEGPLAAAALTGAAGARRRLVLGMLLLPGWQVPLPAPDLPEDVIERHLAWAMAPPALIRAGEDAAWVGHVEALLDWLADRLEREDLPPALRLRLARLAGRIDLGQLLLIERPLRGVHAARNRVLAQVALRDGARADPAPQLAPASAAGGVAAPARRIRIGILCRTFDKGPDSEA
ncbi:glycosyltransferase family 61 protein, partial [Tabrizicola sp. DMG-N-6]|nr:glycosyltransferase family 61 protein [Szabonella alba]